MKLWWVGWSLHAECFIPSMAEPGLFSKSSGASCHFLSVQPSSKNWIGANDFDFSDVMDGLNRQLSFALIHFPGKESYFPASKGVPVLRSNFHEFADICSNWESVIECQSAETQPGIVFPLESGYNELQNGFLECCHRTHKALLLVIMFQVWPWARGISWHRLLLPFLSIFTCIIVIWGRLISEAPLIGQSPRWMVGWMDRRKTNAFLSWRTTSEWRSPAGEEPWRSWRTTQSRPDKRATSVMAVLGMLTQALGFPCFYCRTKYL